MTRPVIRFSGIKAVLLAAGLASSVLWMSAAPAQNLIDATTAAGEKVRLHPNGRWEYVDVQKAAAAKIVADQYPENRTRPVDAQGCLLGVGRCLMPGDKDYNRGTLNPAKR